MKRISIRLPEDLIAAYDSADGNRSAVMRRRLAEAVVDGELSDVDADLRTLAEAEAAKDEARLARRRGSFRERAHSFYGDKWSGGMTTPDDARDMAVSWETEAALYGADYVAFLDAMLGWFSDNWTIDPGRRPEWPDGSVFLGLADPSQVDVPERLIGTVEDELAEGRTAGEIVDKLSAFHPESVARRAVALADGGDNVD